MPDSKTPAPSSGRLRISNFYLIAFIFPIFLPSLIPTLLFFKLQSYILKYAVVGHPEFEGTKPKSPWQEAPVLCLNRRYDEAY